MRQWIGLTALVLAGVAGGCGVVAEGPMVSETIEETVALPADGRVTLKGINGKVEIDSWQREEVYIHAEKKAAGQKALDDLEVEIDSSAESVRITTRFHKDPLAWFGDRRQSVDYHVTVPEGASLDLVTVNGGLQVMQVSGSVRAKSVNGRILASALAGNVDLSNVNGGITLELPPGASRGDATLSTVNGGVEIVAPPGSGGELSARSINGGVRSDLPFEREDKGWGPMKRVRGRFGEGGARLDVKTVNGGIHIEAPAHAGT